MPLRKIPGTPAYAVTSVTGHPSLGDFSAPGFADVSRLVVPSNDPGGGSIPQTQNMPRQFGYAQLSGLAGTPGGQPVDFGTSLSAHGGSGSPVTSGSGDPLQTVADAFLAALGSAPGAPGAPTILYPSADSGASTGGGMNIKSIVILVVIAAAAYFAWKKWGKAA